jgi:hypothetical protein
MGLCEVLGNDLKWSGMPQNTRLFFDSSVKASYPMKTPQNLLKTPKNTLKRHGDKIKVNHALDI